MRNNKEKPIIPASGTNFIKLKKPDKVYDIIQHVQKERKHKCDLCEKSFVLNHHLRKHMEVHKPNGERIRFPCRLCSKMFLEKSQVEIHMNVHTRETQFKCKFCEKSFSTTYSRLAHIKKIHLRKKLHKCNQCSASFVCRSKLTRHEITHRTDEADQILLKCPKCEKVFTQAGHLKCHLLFHENPNQFACNVCGKSFGRKCSLDRHKLIHGTHRRYSCSFCPQEFTRFDELTSHIRIHTNERPFKCPGCSKMFKLSSSLRLHLSFHQGRKIKTCQFGSQIIAPKFRCNICLKYLSSNASTIAHMNAVHLGEKQFNCEFCKKEFGRKQNLESHIRGVHLNEKPYGCRFCDKKYAHESSLRKHFVSRLGSLCRQKYGANASKVDVRTGSKMSKSVGIQ